jgi:hypothetical protein
VPTGALEEAVSAVGGKSAAPLGAHGNIVKLITAAYGQVLGQLKTADDSVQAPSAPAQHERTRRSGLDEGQENVVDDLG